MSAVVDTRPDFHEFHRRVLPGRLAGGNGLLAVDDARAIGPIAIRTAHGAYTYVAGDETIEILEGDETARTVVVLDDDAWWGLIDDLETAPGLFYSGRIEVARGNPLRFVRWEPALRAMFHGRPIYDPEHVDLRGHDPAAAFTLDDLTGRPDVIRDHLDAVGYLLVRDVFSSSEVDTFLADAEQLAAEAREGDRQSWWGRDARGDSVLCRVLRAGTRPRLRALYDDSRVRALQSVPAGEFVSRAKGETDGVTVLWKRPGVTEGLADLPWHRDCGMGGHGLNCPTLVATICLTDGSEAAGELRMLPGSHLASYPFVDGTDERAPRGVSLAATKGSTSLHFSDVMHASMPPTAPEGPHRVSVLLGFTKPDWRHHRGERHYNDVLLGREDGQVEHLADKIGARRN